MKILIISRYYILKFGGGETNDRELGRALKKLGNEVRCLAGVSKREETLEGNMDVYTVSSPYLYPI